MRVSQRQYERRFVAAALDHFDITDGSSRLLKYSNTALYRVATPHERFVLRLHPPGRMSEAALHSELDWLATLRQETTLWVPEPVAGRGDQRLATCWLPDRSDYRYAALFHWMPGQHKLQQLMPRDAERMGHVLGELHAFAATYTPPTAFARWTLDWGAFADEALRQQGWYVPAPDAAELLARAMVQVRRVLDQLGADHDAHGLIHGDTNLSNFRFDGARVGLLDFEVCCFGYYAFDITRTLLDFALLGGRADSLEAAFYRGYAAVRSLPALDDPRMLAFRVMNLVDLIVWIMRWDERMPRATGPARIRHALQQIDLLLLQST